MSTMGVVAIGRNEGQRLIRCLQTVLRDGAAVVYVDSGSTDGSVDAARSMGVEVVELDCSVPFSAARARNEGFGRLRQLLPALEYVQFVDGDCEVVEGWLDRAAEQLRGDETLAVVCGRRRERFREASVYNRLCDMEWDTPVGEAKACGGDAIMRASAFAEVGGFDPAVIAGEEPELCQRLRRARWRIVRVDADMTIHDAAMSRFTQWWKRATRAGYAYALGAHMHGRGADRHWVRETRRVWLWGLAVPLLVLALLWLTRGGSLLLLGAYLALFLRVRRGMRARGFAPCDARLYAWYCVLAKFPEMLGQMRFCFDRIRGRGGALIEYKTSSGSSIEAAP